jgi:hypothetical protein
MSARAARRHVILDTNAIDLKDPFGTNPERLILDAATKGQVVLVVPELVIREVMNVWRERATEQMTKASAEMVRLAAYGISAAAPGPEDLERRGAEVEAEMRAKLAAAGASVPGFPPVSHEEIVQRALDRRQPFDARGKDGYRDAVLWHVVLDIADTEQITLVSNDGSAFSEGRKFSEGPGAAALSARLQAEVQARTSDPLRVELVRELRTLTDELAEQDGQILEQVRRLAGERSFRTLVEEALEEAVSGLGLGVDAIAALNVGVSAEHVWVAGMEEMGAMEPVRAYKLPGAEALVEFDIVLGLRIAIQFGDPSAVQQLRTDPDYWVEDLSPGWDDLRQGDRLMLGTFRLGHLRVDASIALPDGRLQDLRAVSVRIADENEELVKPAVIDDSE